jgi:hypothetical protein
MESGGSALLRQYEFAASSDLQQVSLGRMLDPDAMRTAKQFPGGNHSLGIRPGLRFFRGCPGPVIYKSGPHLALNRNASHLRERIKPRHSYCKTQSKVSSVSTV